jgi:predicted MPP superfamily phosphohydrolase
MRLAWATDVHLNFLDAAPRHQFYQSLGEDSDAVAISGDIAESTDIEAYLREMEQSLRRPIYFVLGNHDFYRGSIGRTREAVARLAAQSEHLVYLTANQVVELTSATALVGHDGWADARLGDFQNSNVILNDYVLIEELRKWRDIGLEDAHLFLDKENLAEALEVLGDEAGRHFERALSEAAEKYANVIAVTHVPPFREAAWYEGRTSDDNFLPHFSCKAAGDAMLRVMKSNVQSNLLVLCGHTHGSGEANLLKNLKVLTGKAVYGSPEVQRVLKVE